MCKKVYLPKGSKSRLGLALTFLRVHSDLIAGHAEDEQARHLDFPSEHFPFASEME